MDLLNLFSGCALILSAQCSPSATPAHPATGVAHWQLIAAKAASAFALPEAWLNAVTARESGGKTVLNGRPITSAAGTMGLMQVMPRTYDDLRKQLGLGADPYAPADNITAGAASRAYAPRPVRFRQSILTDRRFCLLGASEAPKLSRFIPSV